MGADVVEGLQGRAPPYHDERLRAGLGLHRFVRGDLREVERGPLRPTAAPGVAIDLGPEVVHELATYVCAADDDEEADHREPDLGRRRHGTEPHEERHEIEDERHEHEGRVDSPEPARLALEVDVVGVPRKRREQHEYDPDADRGGRRGALARKIEHQRDDVRADRYVGDRRVERMAEPHAVQQIFDRRHRPVERGEDRDEELTERIGPYGLRVEDPLTPCSTRGV